MVARNRNSPTNRPDPPSVTTNNDASYEDDDEARKKNQPSLVVNAKNAAQSKDVVTRNLSLLAFAVVFGLLGVAVFGNGDASNQDMDAQYQQRYRVMEEARTLRHQQGYQHQHYNSNYNMHLAQHHDPNEDSDDEEDDDDNESEDGSDSQDETHHHHYSNSLWDSSQDGQDEYGNSQDVDEDESEHRMFWNRPVDYDIGSGDGTGEESVAAEWLDQDYVEERSNANAGLDVTPALSDLYNAVEDAADTVNEWVFGGGSGSDGEDEYDEEGEYDDERDEEFGDEELEEYEEEEGGYDEEEEEEGYDAGDEEEYYDDETEEDAYEAVALRRR